MKVKKKRKKLTLGKALKKLYKRRKDDPFATEILGYMHRPLSHFRRDHANPEKASRNAINRMTLRDLLSEVVDCAIFDARR